MRPPEFWSDPESRISRLLAPLGLLYDSLSRLRRRRAQAAAAPPVPLICVGNLVAGGAGKTPVARAIARRLAAHGFAVHLLGHGYRGREAGPIAVDPARPDALGAYGDEALLLARVAPTWIARARAQGIMGAARAGAEIIVMDDGFQDPRIAPDLALLVIDEGYGIGNGRVMPAGPLRETATSGLARADAIIRVARPCGGRAPVLALLPSRIPTFHARYEARETNHPIAGRRVLAFAGIARPDKFYASLEAAGARIAETRSFGDHHLYRPRELARLVERARVLGVHLVTTEKDAVRIPEDFEDKIEIFAIDAVFEDWPALDRLIEGAAGLKAVRDSAA